MQIVSKGDKMHERLKLIFWENKTVVCCNDYLALKAKL